jgi:hypothetical protein
VCLKWFPSLIHVWHKSCTNLVWRLTLSRNRKNELPFDPHHLGGPSGAAKKIFMPMVHSTQTMHLSCTEINSVSKQTEASFYLTHISEEFHRVRQKWFLSLLHVRHKWGTYLASRLALSRNRPKWASVLPTSPKSSIGCAQNDFWAYCMFSATVHLSCVLISTISGWTKTSFQLTPSPRRSIRCD